MDSIRERRVNDVLIEAIDACREDQETTATEKLAAITGAVELLLKYETELDVLS